MSQIHEVNFLSSMKSNTDIRTSILLAADKDFLWSESRSFVIRSCVNRTCIRLLMKHVYRSCIRLLLQDDNIISVVHRSLEQ